MSSSAIAFRRSVSAIAAARVIPTAVARASPILTSATHLATARRSLATASPGILLPLHPKNSPAVPVADPPLLPASLRLKSGHSFEATSFGAPLTSPVSGEVVFTTSLVGYPESMTDPSYRGQILVFTQPLIGNYGVPAATTDQWGLLEHFESDAIQVKAIIVNDYATKYSHWNAIESLGAWCARNGVVALSGVDTRAIVTLLRERGSTLGRIDVGKMVAVAEKEAKEWVADDPNGRNLSAEVSVKERQVYNAGAALRVALIDCGVKQNIIRCLVSRGVEVHLLPWNHSLSSDPTPYDGLFISNGPGDPRHLTATVSELRTFMSTRPSTPIFGICMGNQLLGMAAGFDVYKLPYGNRGHNQPAIDLTTGRCVITSQNHGFAIDDGMQMEGWKAYFRNANDGSNEGIVHTEKPWRSVQFHPEAKGGPMDTEYLFEEFVGAVRKAKFGKIGKQAGTLGVEQVLQA
ncbi:carbamoyl-phosphate synthase subunit arginine-specific small [Cladochytrium replicatum]|nr:carbamoyl-phosphate synthase subunit arginine-specific small [Cladochytrium replicatum]